MKKKTKKKQVDKAKIIFKEVSVLVSYDIHP